MAYLQCPECRLTVPATAYYLRGDECPRCLTSMEPRDRFRPDVTRAAVAAAAVASAQVGRPAAPA